MVDKRLMSGLGIETSLLGFGCMRFPTDPKGAIDEKTAEKMIDDAIAAGVNYIDTAYPYHNGDSEPFVGRVLGKYPRDSYFLATKLPCWQVNSLEDAEKLFDSQLERLNKDYVDFYLLHSLNINTWRKMKELGVIEFCEKLKADGKIRYLGFSFHDSYEVFEEILTYRKWDFCQIQLNYMDTGEQAGIRGYELTEKLGVPLVIMEPVKGGSLAVLPDDITAEFKKLDPSASTASWAMRWVGSLPNVKVILSGMSDESQVKDNLETFTDFKPLNDEEKAAVERIAGLLEARVNNGCTGCNYCMPCPAGVNIPRNFKIWNTYGIYENVNSTKWQWEHDMDEAQKAKNCISCGKCEKACPQKLQIRSDLKKLQSQLDGLCYK
ncbi:aldo/keto reductase [Ruminococcus sp. Marseille-P6503]|uniref:aldo/keto reductase n=1 Tax=Ruminococcus sp. Marseille-P6503 TaxID=2364796 RepID=UPI000F51CA56|nr:aldo/keto reductase [Ruminococcus sp. Marseille-P6503]